MSSSDPKRPPDPKGKPDAAPQSPIPGWAMIALLLFLLFVSYYYLSWFLGPKTLTYSEFRAALDRGDIIECKVAIDYIEGKMRNPALAAEPKPAGPPSPLEPAAKKAEFNFRTVRVNDRGLTNLLVKKGVKFEGERQLSAAILLVNVLPLVVLVVLGVMLFRRIGSAGESVLSFSRNRARLAADKDTGVTFEDVAGCDEAKEDLKEVVEFLRSPDRYEALGARIPKGALLIGPPGTGKTLLARAVAGEAKVPFFSISGSDFVEMFVGVGAARVRDLFQQAKKHAPCIIFIDELDAIGRQRGVHVGAVNDEREQTLNQLLVEMDGFETNAGVIILAATNRPDVLDRALLRPGRFDRQIVVDAPDRNGRIAILKVHARDKKLAPGVDLERVAATTPGFAGADLANAMNEAALMAVRRGHTAISQRDLEDAVEKVVAGPERKSRRLSETEKRRVAYHEAGHALVAFFCEFGDKVEKISIVPRGRMGGYTLLLPPDDQMLATKPQLLDKLRSLLGGRAAEEIVYGDCTTGPGNDLERTTALAKHMVCVYGMGEAVGLMNCADRVGPAYLTSADAALQLDCSPDTGREIDLEIKKMLEGAYEDAKRMINQHRAELERLVAALEEHETVDAKQFAALMADEIPEFHAAEPGPVVPAAPAAS